MLITVNDPANCHSAYSPNSSADSWATPPHSAQPGERPVVRNLWRPTLITVAAMARPQATASAYCHESIRCGTAEPPNRQLITLEDPKNDHT